VKEVIIVECNDLSLKSIGISANNFQVSWKKWGRVLMAPNALLPLKVGVFGCIGT